MLWSKLRTHVVDVKGQKSFGRSLVAQDDSHSTVMTLLCDNFAISAVMRSKLVKYVSDSVLLLCSKIVGCGESFSMFINDVVKRQKALSSWQPFLSYPMLLLNVTFSFRSSLAPHTQKTFISFTHGQVFIVLDQTNFRTYSFKRCDKSRLCQFNCGKTS